MAKDSGEFFDHRHNKTVAMWIFHGGRFWHLRVLNKNGNIQKSGEKDGDSDNDACCDDDEA